MVIIYKHMLTGPVSFGVAEVSCPNILCSACRKSSGFARMLLFPKKLPFENFWGATAPILSPPPPLLVSLRIRVYLYPCIILIYRMLRIVMPQSHETTAAVRSYISTVSRNSSAAAVFLRLHTLAVTLATAAVRRIVYF